MTFVKPSEYRTAHIALPVERIRMVNRTVIVSLIVAFAILLTPGMTILSQAPVAKVPNVSGVWGWGRCLDGTGFNCMLIEADSPLLTKRARSFVEAFDETAAPKYECAPMSIPHLYTDPYAQAGTAPGSRHHFL